LSNINNIEVLILNEIDWKINHYTSFSLQNLLFEEVLTLDDLPKINEIKSCCRDYNFYCNTELSLLVLYSKFVITITVLRLALRQYNCESSIFALEELVKKYSETDLIFINECEESILVNLSNVENESGNELKGELSSDYCSPEKKLLSSSDIEEIQEEAEKKQTPIINRLDSRGSFIFERRNEKLKTEKTSDNSLNLYSSRRSILSSQNITTQENSKRGSVVSFLDLEFARGETSFRRYNNKQRCNRTLKMEKAEKYDKIIIKKNVITKISKIRSSSVEIIREEELFTDSLEKKSKTTTACIDVSF
jgi:hypothetical protein